MDEYWASVLALMILLQMSKNEASKAWQDFEFETSHQNRYFPNLGSIKDILERCSKEASFPLLKGALIYRARTSSENDMSEKAKDLTNEYLAIQGSMPEDLHSLFEKAAAKLNELR